MIIRWLGQASFAVTTAAGTRVRTDPFDESLGLPVSKEPADVVTVSHAHFDHNAVHLVGGEQMAASKAPRAVCDHSHAKALRVVQLEFLNDAVLDGDILRLTAHDPNIGISGSPYLSQVQSAIC